MKTDIEETPNSAGYWDREARNFDSIYHEDGRVRGWLNRLLRGDMEERYFFALKAARLDSHPHILDIGCGTGVHARGFLEAGAASVTGADLSPEMLKIAAERLQSYGDRVRLIEGDFMDTGFAFAGRAFDVVTAIGVFDYIAEPRAFMAKAVGLTKGRFIATFPRSGTPRARLRAIRLSLRRCPVYFYSKAQIDAMAEACGARIERYAVIGQLHCACFEPL